jgi:Tfp pilus assembly protein PilV
VRRLVRRLHSDERGGGLIEVLVSSALLGIALMGLMASMSTFALTSRGAEDRAIAQALARAQAARIVVAPYAANGDYSAYYDTVPAAFNRTVTVSWWNGTGAWVGATNGNGLELIALTITQGGQQLTYLEFVKSSR